MPTVRAPRLRARRLAVAATTVVTAGVIAATAAGPAAAAKSDGCVNGAYSVTGAGAALSGTTTTTVPASALGATFQVTGLSTRFTVRSADLAVLDYTFTGAPNPLDMTGGAPLVVFAEKSPDLRGATLTGALTVQLGAGGIELGRAGAGVSMKIQAKDCAAGGIFQQEPERSDGTPTVITHRLADGVFYYDNPNFRARIGQVLNGVTVAARVNIGAEGRSRFVARDSPQVADRLDDCANAFGTQCGGISRWSVASGGRLGLVSGEDAVEVAPPSSDCTHKCQAQDRVRGKFAVLGFPFPVPAASRLTPRVPAGL